jgi:hypothetical protein
MSGLSALFAKSPATKEKIQAVEDEMDIESESPPPPDLYTELVRMPKLLVLES